MEGRSFAFLTLSCVLTQLRPTSIVLMDNLTRRAVPFCRAARDPWCAKRGRALGAVAARGQNACRATTAARLECRGIEQAKLVNRVTVLLFGIRILGLL